MIQFVRDVAVVGIRQLVFPSQQGYPKVEVIPDACLQIKEGRFAFIGPKADAPGWSGESIDLEGAVVTPGLVDAHTHFVWAGTRANDYELRSRKASYSEIAAQGGGIMSSVRSLREASDEELWRQARRNLGWMIENGAVAAEVKSGYGLSAKDEARMLACAKSVAEEIGVEVKLTALAAHAVPPEFASADDYWSHVKDEILPDLHASIGFDAVDMFVEAGYFGHEHARALAHEAERYSAKVRLHVDQMSDSGGAKLAAEIGAASADHLEWTSEAGMEAMSEAGVVPILLPGSVFGLGLSKYPGARRMIEFGLKPVIATDFNPGSAPSPSLTFSGGLAMLYMQMSPQEVLWGITELAADAIEVERGRIKPDSAASLCAWSVQDWREVFMLTGSRSCAVSIVGRT